MNNIPAKLRKDPILETIFEMRFSGTDAPVADVLAGILYSKLESRFPKIDRLPFAGLPRELQIVDPNLKYQPRSRLEGGQFAVLCGDHSVLVSCNRPYPGWIALRPVIQEVIQLLKDHVGLIGMIERMSIKYVNLFAGADFSEQFAAVTLSARLGTYELTRNLTQIRTEIRENSLIHVVELLAGADVKTVDGAMFHGLLLNVDTILPQPQAFWDQWPELLEEVRSAERRLFFSIISQEALDRCEPEWSTEEIKHA